MQIWRRQTIWMYKMIVKPFGSCALFNLSVRKWTKASIGGEWFAFQIIKPKSRLMGAWRVIIEVAQSVKRPEQKTTKRWLWNEPDKIRHSQRSTKTKSRNGRCATALHLFGSKIERTVSQATETDETDAKWRQTGRNHMEWQTFFFFYFFFVAQKNSENSQWLTHRTRCLFDIKTRSGHVRSANVLLNVCTFVCCRIESTRATHTHTHIHSHKQPTLETRTEFGKAKKKKNGKN